MSMNIDECRKRYAIILFSITSVVGILSLLYMFITDVDISPLIMITALVNFFIVTVYCIIMYRVDKSNLIK